MSKFHHTVPRYTEQQWAALKHRNGYSPKPIAPPSPPPETLPMEMMPVAAAPPTCEPEPPKA